MFDFAFVEGLTWLAMMLCGLIGFFYSGEKLLSYLPFWGDTEDKQTKIIKLLCIGMGVFAAAWLTLLILDDNAQFVWLTVILLVAFMITSLAHPIRKLEGWSVVLLAIPFIIVALVAFWFKNDRQFTVFGFTLNFWFVLAVVAIIMLLLFILVFFIEESFVDPVLFFLGWSPVVFVVSLLVLLQGLLLLFNPIEGLLKYITL